MKQIRIMALGLALSLALTACGGAQSGQKGNKQSEAPANHLEQIKAAGKIVLGTSADYPPFEYHEIVNGKDTITGWEIEMAQAIADKLGVALEIKEGKFETLIADLNTEKTDFVISAMSIDEDRKQSADFSEPYFHGGQVVLAKKANAGELKDAASLNGKTVGVQLGSTGEEAAREVEGATIKSFDAFEAAVLDLISDRVDAVVADYAVAQNYAKSYTDLVVAFELSKEDYGVVFRKGDDELREAVNAILAELLENGTIDQLIAKYEAAAPAQ
ncbi:polar amino acid transport system substrate-binding protein [Symbiobacterium terraclitae]|uniref:Polar amino acid transport system substrate-binding protein n=1 Tax=Symbiobacterium terraclitae TaxID=557451 RepID=A0ABS4JVI4_9FIRM|nr:basic amino acid ABC transporter substrate-binding protein [Symbiobacterium terraclitae]MBP2019573.1 polar amino acid transport system substrate-binding protein [Symbiobacterium terraclitae]